MNNFNMAYHFSRFLQRAVRLFCIVCIAVFFLMFNSPLYGQEVAVLEKTDENVPTFMDYHNNYFFGFDMGLSFGKGENEPQVGLEFAGYVKRKLNKRNLIGLRYTIKILSLSAMDDLVFHANDFNLEYNYLLRKPMKFTPYVLARIGTGFTLRDPLSISNVRNTGIFPGGGIGLGLLYSVGNSALLVEISYSYQTYSYLFDSDSLRDIKRKQVYDNVGIRLGFWF